ncbi:MAG: FAD-binding protein [Dehalococcoidales bacterium]|nr:FAD-binding protein [Dehalococcoidales bacterium]
MPVENIVETDILVIGGGIAGCFAAIKAREQGLDVTLVDKSYVGKSGCTMNAGMNFTVYNPELGSDFEATLKRINEESEYLNNREWTEIVMRESWGIYQDLDAWGVEFPIEEGKEGRFYTIYPPFVQARIVRRGVAPPLRKQALKTGVRIIDKITITDLLIHDGKVVGAIGFPVGGLDYYIFKAKAVVASTGGWTLKQPGSDNHYLTGDGQAIAYRAGAELIGRDTFSAQAGSAEYPSWRGARAARSVYRCYTDAEGVKLAHGYESGIGLDVSFHQGQGPIYHDLTNATSEDVERMWKRQLRSDAMESERVGFDPHNRGKYLLSGCNTGTVLGASVWPVNTKCATTLPGLYVAGDTCGHLAAFWGGLVPGGVTGARAGRGAAEYALQSGKTVIDEEDLTRKKSILYEPLERKKGFSPRWVTQMLLNTLAPYYVLIIKHGDRLQAALTNVEFFKEHYAPKLFARDSHELRLVHETKNMILGAEIVLKTCLLRTESRGLNFREDFPQRDDPNWLAWIKIRADNGRISLWKEPVPEKWWPDLSLPYDKRYPNRQPWEIQ